MPSSDQDRRAFLKWSSSVLAGTAIAGCIDESNQTEKEDDDGDIAENVDLVANQSLGDSDSDNGDGIGKESSNEIDNSESESKEQETSQFGHLHGITGQTSPPDMEGNNQRRFEWSAVGGEWWFEQNIPKSLERYYDQRYGRSDEFSRYVSDWYGQPIIEGLTSEFKRLGDEYSLSDREVVDLTTAFVQQLRYTEDKVATGFDQYTSYPVETLNDRGGDCEDTTILLAAILREMGYGCILLGLYDTEPAHMALGVKGDSSIPGTYYEYNGNPYYYVETTGEGWKIGEMPDFEGSTNAQLLEITQNPTIVYRYETSMTGNGEIEVNADITNVSDVAAMTPEFSAIFENTMNNVVASAETRLGVSLSGGTTESVSLKLVPPDDVELRLGTVLSTRGGTHDLHRSEWRTPV